MFKFGFFSIFVWGQSCLVSVTVDDVHDVINVSTAEVPGSKILKMIKRAEVVEKSVQGVIKTKSLLDNGRLGYSAYG